MEISQSLWNLIQDHGVTIGAAASLIFFLLEVLFDVGRTEKKTATENIKTFMLLAGATITMGFAIYTLYKNFELKTPTTQSNERIVEYYDRCSERVQSLSDDRAINLAAEPTGARLYTPNAKEAVQILQYYCLALAMRSDPVRPPQESPVGRLAQDTSLAARLIAHRPKDVAPTTPTATPTPAGAAPAPKVNASIADTLRLILGIETTKFTGTGRTLPKASNGKQSDDYGDATLKEYLVPNVCAEQNIKLETCPLRSPRAWGWRLKDLDAPGYPSLREFLMHVPPKEGGDTEEFRRLLGRLANMDRVARGEIFDDRPPVLVRFTILPERFYAGTVGRPIAKRVFFSSLADSSEVSIRRAFEQSGAGDPAGLSADPDAAAFIWIYEPQTDADHFLGTWNALFDFLKNAPVTDDIKAIANAKVWPPKDK